MGRTDNQHNGLRAIPRWVWLVIAVLAATEPAVHIWITYFPPSGLVPTGLDGPDSAAFLHAMRMFHTDFYSPYATCQAEAGSHSPTYFNTLFFWMYGAIGFIGNSLHANEFILLGLANALGGAFYLLAAFLLFQTIAPERARLAFLLFTLGGGLGGVLYILTGLAGWHGHPNFDAYFLRYAYYELIEGTRTFPVIMFPRLYYTIPLALGLLALRSVVCGLRTPHPTSSEWRDNQSHSALGCSTASKETEFESTTPKEANTESTPPKGANVNSRVQAQRSPRTQAPKDASPGRAAQAGENPETSPRSNSWLAIPCLLLFVATLLNMRQGPMIWGVVLLYACVESRASIRTRIRLLMSSGIAVLIALILSGTMYTINPVSASSGLVLVRQSMYLSAFASVAFFHIFLMPGALYRRLGTLPPLGRITVWAALGYLATYTMLFAVWHVYYGTYLRCGDFGAAKRISDPALIGALAGALYGWRASKQERIDTPSQVMDAWLVLWFLAIFSISISAFGGGWFLRLVPERFMALLAPPLCLLSAATLQRWRQTRPRIARTLLTTTLCCGVCSILVATLCFKGPLGVVPGKGAYAALHREVMTENDARCLEALEAGTVLTTKRFGDVVALRGNETITGTGMLSFSHQSTDAMHEIATEFFTAKTGEARRREIAEQWCIDWLYCPDAPPMDERTVETLRATPWLKETAAAGRAVLFRVEL